MADKDIFIDTNETIADAKSPKSVAKKLCKYVSW